MGMQIDQPRNERVPGQRYALDRAVGSLRLRRRQHVENAPVAHGDAVVLEHAPGRIDRDDPPRVYQQVYGFHIRALQFIGVSTRRFARRIQQNGEPKSSNRPVGGRKSGGF